MYQPAHFVENDAQALAALMAAYPLAGIVRQGPEGLAADHVPLRWNPGPRTLRGHVARANPLWREAQDAGPEGLPVLAIFRAEQAYISPNWYPGKAATHQAVPTWNYAVAHAHGRLRAIDDAGWLRSLLAELTAQHEQRQPKPWSMADAPEDYLGRMVAAVVGIEITVERLDGKAKLSQNRPAADREGVVLGLRADGAPGAEAMADRVASPRRADG